MMKWVIKRQTNFYTIKPSHYDYKSILDQRGSNCNSPSKISKASEFKFKRKKTSQTRESPIAKAANDKINFTVDRVFNYSTSNDNIY
jgi:hypothetical protein